MVKAQKKLSFTHLTVADGLASNVVFNVLQDRQGYLWMGTQGGGLLRYDGYEVKEYRHIEGDEQTLSHDWVRAFLEASDGMLWIGTDRGGLNRFDPETETFRSYRHVEGDSTSLSHDVVFSLHESRDGMLWVGTWGGGLNRFDPETETFKSYQHIAGDSTSLSHDWVYAIQESKDGLLWIGTDGGGLNRFDRETQTFRNYRHVENDPTSLSNDVVFSMDQSEDGTLWIGTWGGGLNRFDPELETFRNYRHRASDSTSLSDDVVMAVHEAIDGTLWIGTLSRGLNRLDPSSETFDVFRYSEDDASSLSNDRVRDFYESEDGTLWIGTWGGGLNRIDTDGDVFRRFHHIEDDLTSLNVDEISALNESADGTIWIGTWGGGLNLFDPESGTFRSYTHRDGDANSLSHNVVEALHESSDGTLWIGTWGGGLNRFDPLDTSFNTYRHIEGDAYSLSNNRVAVIHESTNGTFWIGTDGGGLNRFDPEQESFYTYRHQQGNANSLSVDAVRSLFESEDGILWIGTWGGGLNRFDPVLETFHSFRNVPSDSMSLSHEDVWAIHESEDDKLWIGTGAGLNRLDLAGSSDPASSTFTRFLEEDGAIVSILEDKEGFLWLGLFSGRMARFNTSTGTVRYFSNSHGLPLGAFTSTALRSSAETFYWGSTSGLVEFHFEDLPPPAQPPILHLSELRIFDEPISPGPNSQLNRSLAETESVRLTHDQNDVTVGFVGLHYQQPEGNRYRYRLLGYDRAWRAETSQRRATYTSLPPGDYTFEVLAANSDGVWTEEPVKLGIEITAPWWRTGLSYTIYGLLFLTSIFVTDRFQRKRLIARGRLRAERESAKVIASTNIELERTLKHLTETQDQLIHTEKMASLGQLTAGIAHEIKNPLNFVTNFSTLSVNLVGELKEWIEKKGGMDEPEVRELVETLKVIAEKTNQHGMRADGIIRSMLEHSRTGTGEKKVVDINKLVDEYVSLSVHGVRAREESFSTEIVRQYDPSVKEVEVYTQEIGRVLINILDNSFYSVNEGRSSFSGDYGPKVTVKTKQVDGYVEIHISDNGVGIPEEIQGKIFEPFFTTKPTGSGTGLGLSLSHDIAVKGHGGDLWVDSTEGEGATFILKLPAY